MNNGLQEIKKFLLHLLANRVLLTTLIKNDFKKQFLGSYFGLFWAFAQPLVYIVVIWFVFTIGFRHVSTEGETPFFLWLISGMIPWFFFASAFVNGSNAIVSNAFLVKKVAFRISILPLVQIGSSLIIHIILVTFLLVSFLLYGFTPSIYWLQIFYYIGLSVFFLVGLSWLTASIRVFVKDISNFIAVVIQVGFWATPIFWNASKVPEKYHYILSLNPMYYIVEGFRDTLINKVWFWQKPQETLIFLLIAIITFIVGALFFKRLRPHFGDVL